MLNDTEKVEKFSRVVDQRSDCHSKDEEARTPRKREKEFRDTGTNHPGKPLEAWKRKTEVEHM